MSEPKAQLVAPVGNISVPGINATGVITASSFSGDGGVVSNLTGSPNLNVGVVTASSFVGECSGHAAGLTGTPNVNLGLTTSTGFIGDATGKASNLTGSPNIEVGLITATSFVGGVTGNVTGNITGTASSIKQGANLNVGVATAVQWYGDGSGLTGAGSTAFIAQEITATSAETIIDLSDGNLIYYKGEADTTVGFASTSAAEQITFVRDTDGSYSISYSTGGVTLDGNDYLTMTGPGDLGTGTDFTQECWAYVESTSGTQRIFSSNQSVNGTQDTQFRIYDGTWEGYAGQGSGNRFQFSISGATTGWHHLALCRGGGTFYFFVDGVLKKSETASHNVTISNHVLGWGLNVEYFTGIISNARFVNGTCLYDSSFVPPKAALTNVTNTSLLCCQSDSSATAATVGPPSGSITANGDPTAGSHTVSLNGSLNATITWPNTVKWNNNTQPVFIDSDESTSFQVFGFTTSDSGATYNAWEQMKNNTFASYYQLWTWGSNSDGVLGNNDDESIKRSSPIQIGGNWSKLGNGNYGAQGNALIKFDKTLWMWGKNETGQLGLSQASGLDLSSPTQIPGTTWANISYSYRSIAAPKTDGTLWAWGQGASGQLGKNNTTTYSSPVQIGTDTTWGKGRYEIYNTTSTFAAIKTDGTMWTWGGGTWGQLGQNQAEAQTQARSSPTQVGTETTWSAVMGGNAYFIATKTDGTLWGWGANSKGALGQNQGGTGPSQPARSSPVQIPGTTWSITGVANAVGMVNAFKTDGTFWTWGDNIKGALGLNQSGGTLTGLSSPTQLPGTTWSKSATMDDGGRVAIKTDGTLWSWGQAQAGQLGLNDVTERSSPTQVGTSTDWVELKGTATATMCAFRSS